MSIRRRALALALLASPLLACSDPYAEVKDRLSTEEIAVFDAGARVANPCWTCHDITGDTTKVGPPLRGLFGRAAASAPGYAYSPALQSSGVVWDEQTLAAFLRDVSGSIPGNRMVSPSVRSPTELGALIFFLREATRPPR